MQFGNIELYFPFLNLHPFSPYMYSAFFPSAVSFLFFIVPHRPHRCRPPAFPFPPFPSAHSSSSAVYLLLFIVPIVLIVVALLPSRLSSRIFWPELSARSVYFMNRIYHTCHTYIVFNSRELHWNLRPVHAPRPHISLSLSSFLCILFPRPPLRRFRHLRRFSSPSSSSSISVRVYLAAKLPA
jgi:hypothetical protein